VELLYYFLGLSPQQRASDWEFHLMIPVTITALGLLTIMLGVNRMKAIPYWVSSTIFLVAMTILALFSDSPQQVMNGRSTLFFLVPILLSGVLIHSYTTFIFSGMVTLLFAAYALLTSGSYLNPLNLIFFFMFSGLVSTILKSLEKSTSELRREAAQRETILSALRGGYILTDHGHRVLRLNAGASRIFPLAQVDVNLLDIIQDKNIEISEEDLKHLTEMISSLEAVEAKIKISGKQYYAATKYISANKENLIFLRDITADVEIERLKDTALAMVSHELRTPLTAIRGHAELATREPSTAAANAKRILLNTQRLLTMVENLLSQSRLRTGKVKIVPSPTGIAGMFRMVHSLLLSEAKEKQLEFVMEVDERIPRVMVDAVLLQQILTNLASNAIKFTNSGKVTMTASLPDEGHWRISVRDTGPGIAVSKRSEIFKEFFQGEDASVYDRPYQGTGLGLSIVKGLTEQLGGTLALQSEEGAGSQFSVTFPLILAKATTRTRKLND